MATMEALKALPGTEGGVDLIGDLQTVNLPDNQTVIEEHSVPMAHSKRELSSIGAIMYLSGAESPQEIGDKGPVLASRSLNPEDKHVEKHLYEAVFGRDSLRVASDLIERYPKLTFATLKKLAEVQGQEANVAREEEPGRIVHEVRNPETDDRAKDLTIEREWDWPYYGSVDSTPEYVSLFAKYCNRSEASKNLLLNEPYIAKDGSHQVMAHALEQALAWMNMRMQANEQGFIEYKSAIPGRMEDGVWQPGGIENQVWRDSPDAYFHSDGTLANFDQGIASLDVQRVTYDALIDAAELYETLPGKDGQAKVFRIQAELLKQQILKHFWTEKDGGFFAVGLDRGPDGELRQLDIKTSDMGHLLNSRLLEGDDAYIVRRREAIIKQLFSENMLAAGGIRTLAKDEEKFNPEAYHNGSVWPMDNYLISQGLRRHGYHALADIIDERLLSIKDQTTIFPEYVPGDDEADISLTSKVIDVWDKEEGKINHLVQPPQEIQAWTVSANLAIKINNGKRGLKRARPTEFETGILTGVIPLQRHKNPMRFVESIAA